MPPGWLVNVLGKGTSSLEPGDPFRPVSLAAMSYLEYFLSNSGFYAYFFLPLLLLVLTWFAWRKLANYPPGPVPVPLCGNYFDLRGTDPVYVRLNALKKTYGPVHSLSLQGENVVCVHGHEMIREALVKSSDSFLCRAQGLTLASKDNGITWRNGPEWQKLRGFTLTSIRDLGGSRYGVEERILEHVQTLNEELIAAMEQPVRIRHLVERTVLNVFCDVIFGIRYNSDDQQFLQLYQALSTLAASPATSFPACSRLYKPVIPNFLQQGACREEVTKAEQLLNQIIVVRLQEHKYGADMRKPRDILDMFVKKGQRDKDAVFADDSIIRTISDLLREGYSNTCACVLWVLLYLLRNPDVQDSCRQEILEKVGANTTVQAKDREKMPYIRAVISEAQRLASIEPLSLPYRAESAVSLGGFTVPRGTVLLCHLQSAHMDQTYWKRPAEFRPSRFLDMDGKLLQHDAFFPFGIGERSCVGEHLATMHVFVMVTNLLRRFKLLLPVGEKAPSADRDMENERLPIQYCLCAMAERL